MISRYEAYMDGVALSSIDENLLILDIQHHPSDIRFNTGKIANRNGSMVISESQEGASVTILFELHLYGIADRQAACQAVQRWAMGNVLETNDRTGQQLLARCTSFPRIDSAMNWTDPIEMTFTAFEHPYWEEKTAETLTFTAGTSGEDTIDVPGNVDGAFVEAEITAQAAVSEISLTVGETSITLSGLALENGQIVRIAYDDRNIQSIKVGNTSLLDKRTGSDDLLTVCGENTVSYSASASVQVTVSVRGLWL